MEPYWTHPFKIIIWHSAPLGIIFNTVSNNPDLCAHFLQIIKTVTIVVMCLLSW